MNMKKYLLFLTLLSILHANNTLAQDVVRAAEMFGIVPEFSNIKLSPDGSKLLMFRNINGQIMLITRSLDNLSDPLNAIPVNKGKYAWVDWLSNDEILLGEGNFGKSKNGEIIKSANGMIILDWTGDTATSISWKGVYPFIDFRVVDILKDDPDHMLIQIPGQGNQERGWKHIVYKRNIRNQKREIYHQGARAIKNWVSDKDHNIRLGFGISRGFKTLENKNIAHYRKDVNSPWEVLYDYNIKYGLGFSKDEWEKAPYQVISFSENSLELYVSKISEHGRVGLYLYNVQLNKIVKEIASDENYDLSNFDFDDDYNLMSYRIEGEKTKIIYVGELGDRLNRIFNKNFPNSTVIIESRSEDKTKMIIRVTSPVNPSTFYFYDSVQRKMEMIGYNYKKVDVEKLSNMTPIRYRSRDGLIIPGYLSLPKGSGGTKMPTIIMPHGGPLARDSWRFDYWTQFLNSQGYAVLQMNYRGSTGYGDDFMRKGYHEWGRKMLEDINDGAKWMISEGYADPERMCIVGANYGGYAALQAIVKNQSLYRCSVAFEPITNMSREFENIRTTYIESKDWTYKEASPSENIDKINVPVLMLHGYFNTNADVKLLRTFNKKMISAGKNIKYIELKSEDHYSLSQEGRIKILKEIGLFLKEQF